MTLTHKISARTAHMEEEWQRTFARHVELQIKIPVNTTCQTRVFATISCRHALNLRLFVTVLQSVVVETHLTEGHNLLGALIVSHVLHQGLVIVVSPVRVKQFDMCRMHTCSGEEFVCDTRN